MCDVSSNVCFLGDTPLSESGEDCFGYRPLARGIATIIDNSMNNPNCLVVGIHGEWGSGKTSAINLLISELKKINRIYSPPEDQTPCSTAPDHYSQSKKCGTEQALVLHFSPWLYSGQENLTYYFFHELNQQLNVENMGKLKEAFLELANASLPILGSINILPLINSKNLSEGLLQLINKKPSLEKVRNKLLEELRQQARPLLIIIDDIDRLPADEMRQIFRLVKSVADLPYVTYILAFDQKIAQRALEKDVDLEGPHWIEKIVQVPMDLPLLIPFKLREFFWSLLKENISELTDELDDNTAYIFDKYLYPQFKNPRQIIRLINTLSVGWATVHKSVNLTFFIVIESWRLFQPDMYVFIKNNYDYLISLPVGLQKLLNIDAPLTPQNERIKYFAKALQIDLKSFFYDQEWENFGMHKRVVNSKTIRHYFLYGAAVELLTLDDRLKLEDNLDDFAEAEKLLKKYSDQTLDHNFSKTKALILDWQDEISHYPKEKIKKIMKFIIFSSTHIIKSETFSKEYSPFYEVKKLLNIAFYQICKNENENEYRDKLIKDIFEEYPWSFYLMCYFNKLFYTQDINFSLDLDHCSRGINENKEIIHNIYKEKLTDLLDDDKLKNQPLSLDFLLLLFKLSQPEDLKNYFIQNPDFTLKVMLFIVYGYPNKFEKDYDFNTNRQSILFKCFVNDLAPLYEAANQGEERSVFIEENFENIKRFNSIFTKENKGYW